MKGMDDRLKAFKRLLDIMDELREKCPWDSKQTPETLRTLTIEETYELADAIIENDYEGMRKELGDLLLHIVFYAKIGSEKGAFDITDVINGICEKLVFRHPHIFSDTKVKDALEVEQNWEKLKLKEKGNRNVLGGVPTSLPAMVKAYRMQDKARAVGFDWEEKAQVFDKIEEELDELKTAVQTRKQGEIENEFGDLLFSVINAARLYDIMPDNALERTNKKFRYRFEYLEEYANKHNKDMKKMRLEEMDAVWNRAKQINKSDD
ncbi:MAG: nucleoside triphosphate pyrophosphohydrolase [Candidatus Delongbacteria bacterium]|jgi:MazG family protein|nr:nucleoside triphosphate pyrophosphohydrolase [Candidatus Delongbacteria bacterium]